jgi:ligand-binding sensor domain-containing protein
MIRLFISLIFITITSVTFISCNEHNKSNSKDSKANESTFVTTVPDFQKDSVNETAESPIVIRSTVPLISKGHENDDTLQVSQYIRRIFQDKNGNLWFGTVTDGVCRYDGKSLTYFTPKDGFAGWGVQSISEDKDGNLWFGTSGGVSKYDGNKFTNFTEVNGLKSNLVLSMLIDKFENIWVGTGMGVFKLNAETFTNFPLPTQNNIEIKSIVEDKTGNIWFATNGAGVFRYDGKSVTNISKKDGLSSDIVNNILADRDGNIWFATKEGLSNYSSLGMPSRHFETFTINNGLSSNDTWNLYQDKTGNIWISVRGDVQRYDRNSFRSFGPKDGLTNIWVGASNGLFRFDGKSFINVTKKGPWPKHFR